jgi:hypothetical protein
MTHLCALPQASAGTPIPSLRDHFSQVNAGIVKGLVEAVGKHAPGVSASSPIGLSGREVMLLIQIAGQHENLKLFEITEVNPKYDVDDRTVKLASQLVYEFLFG